MIPFRSKRSPLLITLIAAYLPALLLLATAVAVEITKGIPVSHFTRDVGATTGIPPYTGAISTIGFFCWSPTAAVCFLTVIVLRAVERNSDAARFLFWAGVLTTILLADDAFMFHEKALRLFGVSNNVVISIYGVFAIVVLFVNRRFVLSSRHSLLLLALSLFAASLFFDKLHDYRVLRTVGLWEPMLRYLLEDGLKFLGIVGWLVYYGWTCLVVLAQECRGDVPVPRASAR